MGGRVLVLALVAATAGCYGGGRANRDVNHAWRGHSRAALEASWGAPATAQVEGSETVLVWTRTGRRVSISSETRELELGAGGAARAGGIAAAEGAAGLSVKLTTPRASVHRYAIHTVARLDPRGTVLSVRGPSLRRGAPSGLNLRWGMLFGVHAGMGRLDDTDTPLPSGGLYMGGMLTRNVGLVGTYSMAADTGDAGGAMGFAWGIAPQWWPIARAWLRAGPAMVLAFDPGFDNAGLEAGVTGGASYALVRSGSFVLDLRADVVVGTATQFGSLGLGVNIN